MREKKDPLPKTLAPDSTRKRGEHSQNTKSAKTTRSRSKERGSPGAGEKEGKTIRDRTFKRGGQRDQTGRKKKNAEGEKKK